MLRLAAGGSSSQATCGDDGRFPDAVRNDGVLGCAVPSPGDPLQITLKVAGAAPVSYPSIADPGSLLMLSLDASDLSAQATTLPWPWPAAGAGGAVHKPGPDPVPPEAVHKPGPDPVPPEAGPEPVAPEPGKPPKAPVVQGPDLAPGAAVPALVTPPARKGAAGSHGKWLIDGLMVGLALTVGFGLAWFLPGRGPQLPQGVAQIAAPPLFEGGGPGLEGRAELFRADRPQAFAAELIRRVALQRPVLAVLPPAMDLPAIPGAPVYRTQVQDWEEVDRQVRSLGRTGGLMPAVVVVGRDTLSAPGAVAEDPPAALAARLPHGSWLGVVVATDAGTVGFLTPWDVQEDGGWQLTQLSQAQGAR
jgi:hypothetical protein